MFEIENTTKLAKTAENGIFCMAWLKARHMQAVEALQGARGGPETEPIPLASLAL
jgi:hypothetical protein